MTNSYPSDFKQANPLVRGIAMVHSSSTDLTYTVNFDTGECECKHGQAWRWDERRWVKNNWCSHKLKALASLAETTGDESLQQEYELQLGKRYNVFIAISAFHKELRRGDTEAAHYWAAVVVAHRGRHGIINYLRNIIFEETRDINLLAYILKLSTYGKSISAKDMFNAVARFAAAPKKWELPHRLDVFLSEMEGYRALVHDFGADVARAHSIIPTEHYNRLQAELLRGFAEGDTKAVQYGLKGIFKSRNVEDGNGQRGHDLNKIRLYNLLIDIHNGEYENAFTVDDEYTERLIGLLTTRNANYGPPGYHEINALCDALTGESPGAGATLPPARHRAITSRPTAYHMPLADMRRVPLYAHDNHTWDGKARMRRYGAVQLKPGADQTDIDFRLCGAYMGVAWRHLANHQLGSIDVPWGDVRWSPKWLWGHLDAMWY